MSDKPTFFHWVPPAYSTHAGTELTCLPPGFAGFWRQSDEMPPAIDLSVFKSICYTAARLLNGKLLQMEFANVTPNFHRALFEWGFDQKRLWLLCNRAYFLIAFRNPCTERVDEYEDSPELAEVLAKISDWRILSRAELETVVDDSALESMAEQDRRTIDRARRKNLGSPARTVGDVIFHYWD
jgi:hypothetical protein